MPLLRRDEPGTVTLTRRLPESLRKGNIPEGAAYIRKQLRPNISADYILLITLVEQLGIGSGSWLERSVTWVAPF